MVRSPLGLFPSLQSLCRLLSEWTWMNYVKIFGDKEIVNGYAERIEALIADLEAPLTLMEVCGTHTMAISRFGIRSLLPPKVRLISGPGCLFASLQTTIWIAPSP